MRSWCLIFEFLKNKIRSFLIDNSKLSKQDDNDDDDEIVSINIFIWLLIIAFYLASLFTRCVLLIYLK